MSENAQFYYEAKVTERLGLARETVHQVRAELLEKEKGHWDQRGRDIVLSEDGLQQLLAYLYEPSEIEGLNFDDCRVAAQKENGTADLIVKRLLPNRSLLIAARPEMPDQDLTVRVKDNSNFRPKMKLKAVPPAPEAVGAAAFYQLEGRCPRYPGRY